MGVRVAAFYLRRERAICSLAEANMVLKLCSEKVA